MMLGLFTLAIAIMTPGMFLSHPGKLMFASYHCPCMTVSIESAIRSLDCRLYLIPVVPMLIPSDTPIVLNCMGTSPASATPFLTRLERSIRCMLQGFPDHQMEEMPTCALDMSASERPVA